MEKQYTFTTADILLFLPVPEGGGFIADTSIKAIYSPWLMSFWRKEKEDRFIARKSGDNAYRLFPAPS
jgi:hypothetical protein